MKIINIVDRTIFFNSGMTLVVTGDSHSETVRFRMKTNKELDGYDFYLKYRNCNGEGDEVALSKSEDESYTILDWQPDSRFSSATGTTYVMIFAMKGTDMVWNTLTAEIEVEPALDYTARIDGVAPSIIVQYIGAFETLTEEVEQYKTLATEERVKAESARDLAEQYRDTTQSYMTTAEGYKNDTQAIKTSALNEITTSKNNAISAVNTEKNNSISAIETKRVDSIDSVEITKNTCIEEVAQAKEESIQEVQSIILQADITTRLSNLTFSLTSDGKLHIDTI